MSNQYEVIKENGKEVKRKLFQKKLYNRKADQVVAVGTKSTVYRHHAECKRFLLVEKKYMCHQRLIQRVVMAVPVLHQQD